MRFFLFNIAIFAFFAAWTSVSAQGSPPSKDFVPLAGIPGVTGDHPSFTDYLNALFRITIGLGALFAVVKIAFAGVWYMMSEGGFTSKEAAKKDIWGALAGLLILLSTVIILDLINPDILNLNIFKSLPGK